MSAFYNENDPKAAAWLRELIKAGLIAPGIVDERSIADVQAADLAGYEQVHFFAGIGGWSYALRLAGWPDDRPVWTGSCPCQPFSGAGDGRGNADHRNLWTEMFRLIRERRPDCAFGEQVAGAVGYGWLDGVSANLEGCDYAVGAAVLGAHSVGSPQIRQRLFWVADGAGRKAWRSEPKDRLPKPEAPWAKYIEQAGRCCSDHDGDLRRAPPDVLLVADGISSNVDAIAGFGNAIVPQVAAEFVRAYMETPA